jgi:hypothetical protein
VTFGGWHGLAWSLQNGADLLLEQFPQFLAAFNRLPPCAIAQCFQNGVGGFHAQVAGQQGRFQVFERALVHRARGGDNGFDLGRQRLARARDGLLHPREKAGFRLSLACGRGRGSCRGVFLAAKKLHQ